MNHTYFKTRIMKAIFKSAVLVAAITTAMCMTSCNDKEDDLGGGGNSGANKETVNIGDGSNAYEINENMTLTADKNYNLLGWVYVTAGNTLTIEPGTVIKGDKESKATLIIERGAKLVAEGEQNNPIVFTSAQAPGMRKPGDWGGIILLGKATNNKGEMTIEGGVRSAHGGSDDSDNSGILKYVRVEYAGIEYSTDNEINSVTFGSVGSGTQVDYVQVSYSGDDSYEWFGGTVNCKHLVALGTWDDDFDTDNGYRGKLQFLVGLRDPKYADKSSSNGFESDNESGGQPIDPRTRPIFANVSLFGPVDNPATYVDEGNTHGSDMGIFQTGVQIRRSSELNLFNSVIAAWPVGLIIENDKSGSTTQEDATAGFCNVMGNVMAGTRKNFQDAALNPKNRTDVVNPADAGTFVTDYWNKSTRKNSQPLASLAELMLQGDPLNINNPDFCPSSTSPLASGADWSHAYVQDAFFSHVSYRGAFAPEESASNNWMSGWTNFDPQNTVY